MFRTIFAFELVYWFKRPLTLIFFALFFLMAFFSTASDSFLSIGGTGQIHRNAPFVIAIAMGILTAIGQVITTAIAGTAVLRDAQLGTEELLFTTRLTKAGYLLGRFCASFVVMVVVYAGLPLGLLIGMLMPWVPADKLGPVTVWLVVQPFLLIALPNLFFVSALLFAVGALTRRLFAVYVTGIVLLVAWQITQDVIGQLDRLRLAAQVDPFALTTTQVAVRYWSVAEKNTRMIPAAGAMTDNRLMWIAIAIGLFAAVAAVFRLRLQQAGGRKRPGERAAQTEHAPVQVPAVALRYDTTAWFGTFVRESLFHVRAIVREPFFLAISVIAIINLLVGTWYTTHPGDSVRWPVSSLVAPGVSDNMFVFCVLLGTLYGGELIWRERQLKADQVQDSMPVPVWVYPPRSRSWAWQWAFTRSSTRSSSVISS
jgi:hypothetical protein